MTATQQATLAIGIIGPGRLGCSLALALSGAGYRVVALSARRREVAEALASRLTDAPLAVAPAALVERCDWVFLTVPDGAIAALAASLPWRPGQAAIHCSGALGLDVLASSVTAGAMAGCLHPLQSFPSPDGDATRFAGIVCGVEAAAPLGEQLERLASDLGATSVRLEGIDRARYHAAAVFASNYAVALMAAAERSWAAAGLPQGSAREALTPLLMGAAANVARQPLPEALTGPVARGDVATVERHLAALAGEPALAVLYAALGAELTRLDLGLDDGVAASLEESFARWS